MTVGARSIVGWWALKLTGSGIESSVWEDDESPESGEKENWVLVVSFFGLSHISIVREYLTLLGGDRPLAFLAAADDFAAENLDRKLDGVGSLLLAVEA